MTGLRFGDAAALADLRTFAGRARRLDAAAALRLVADGGVLAAYTAVLHGGGGPTVLGLRTQLLAEPATVDVTVPVGALLPLVDRAGLVVDLPEVTVPDAAWAGVLPPRGGWSFHGLLEQEVLPATARAGIAEVAAGTPGVGGTPGVAGAAAVAALRARVWGRTLPGSSVPAGVAFAAEACGFLGSGDEAVGLHRSGPWWRVSLARGHVLARASSLL